MRGAHLQRFRIILNLGSDESDQPATGEHRDGRDQEGVAPEERRGGGAVRRGRAVGERLGQPIERDGEQRDGEPGFHAISDAQALE